MVAVAEWRQMEAVEDGLRAGVRESKVSRYEPLHTVTVQG